MLDLSIQNPKLLCAILFFVAKHETCVRGEWARPVHPPAASGQSDDDRLIALDVININHAPPFFATTAIECGPCLEATAEQDRNHVLTGPKIAWMSGKISCIRPESDIRYYGVIATIEQ